MRISSLPYRLAALALGAAPLALPLPLRADTTVATEVVVTGGPQQARPSTEVTTRYRGGKARVEVAGGPVTLYEAGSDKLYRLAPDRKAYQVTSTKKGPDAAAILVAARAMGRAAGAPGERPEGSRTGGDRREGDRPEGMPPAEDRPGGDRADGPGMPGGRGEGRGMGRGMANLKVEMSVKVKAEKEHKQIAGQDAQRYTFTGTETLAMEMPSGLGGGMPGGGGGPRGGGFPGGGFPGGRRGGYGGGGGFPGGGFPGGRRGGERPGGGGRQGGMRPTLPFFTLEGEFWFADGPAGMGIVGKKSIAVEPLVAQCLPENVAAAAFLKPLVDRLAKAKARGIPVAGRVSLTAHVPSRLDAPAEQSAPQPLVVSMEVRQIAEGDLNDTLFALPADYQQVEAAPARPETTERPR